MNDSFGLSAKQGLFRRSVRDCAEAEDGWTSLCLAIEEIGHVDQSMGITVEAAVGLGCPVE